MSVAFLFPGQGSQYAGMLYRLPDDPAVKQTLTEMSGALDMDILSLDTEEALRSTVAVQIALLAAGVGTARALQQSGVMPIAVAGLSVGAFAAAVVAGTIPLADAARLVRSRAQQMERRFTSGYGMGVVVGLTEQQVTRLVAEHFNPRQPVYVGNVNAPRQIVISGSLQSMDAVLSAALLRGATRAERLRVAVPSHCPLMQPVADSLRQQLDDLHLHDPEMVYIANVTARAVRSAAGVSQDLSENIAHGVRWHDAVCVAGELGCRLLIEMCPGHVWSDLAKANLEDVMAIAVDGTSLPQVLRGLPQTGARSFASEGHVPPHPYDASLVAPH